MPVDTIVWTEPFGATGVKIASGRDLGTTHNIEQGGEAAEKPLPPGSAWSQPAKTNHLTKCEAGADCVVYIQMLKGFSFTPQTADGKAVPAAKKEDAAKK